ncbi:DUF6266 family protein [Gelidibacter gilvus]|uniref:Uncharacterized protein n=1 Tax=Gelidibacter gilvus TaxID=59602 RepID=A0A4V1LMX5_9FLAO|nr:DUF6266 family protein [Gelidibacter gilvus]RXJ50022.1 hypothetical protein ESZ48_08490 [Gelidibacter gilvus]
MAVFEKGILGGFSGKVGNVVGARWRGKNIMRSLPQRGNYVPTEEQLIQREKFSAVIKFLTPLKPIVGKYFGQKQGHKSIYNLATSYHLREALVDDGGVYRIDYPKVLISKGELRGLMDPAVAMAAGQVLELAWSDNSGQGYAHDNDQLIVVVFSPDADLYQLSIAIGRRDLAGTSIALPAYMAGLDIQVWATFATANGKVAAISMYLGEHTVS